MSEGSIHLIYPENGHDPFAYEEIQINDRGSMQEHQFDHAVRQRFWHIHSGDIVFDIGAGFGVYTLCALARGAKFVYAFESNPNIMQCLRANLGLKRNNNNSTMQALERSSAIKRRVDDNQNSIDKFIEGLSFPINRISWIKIDTGDIAENINVLQGARNTIKKFKPNILINGPDDAAARLSEYGKILYNDEQGHKLVIFER